MARSTIETAGTGGPLEPMLPIGDVRAEVAAATNVDAFDRWLELALARTERTGDFTRFRTELRSWLRTALTGIHQQQVIAAPYEERTALLDQLIAEWKAAHPPHTNFGD